MVLFQWVYKDDKTPSEKSIYKKNGKLRNMSNGRQNIKVDSLYTDKKLGIKKKGYKTK